MSATPGDEAAKALLNFGNAATAVDTERRGEDATKCRSVGSVLITLKLYGRATAGPAVQSPTAPAAATCNDGRSVTSPDST